MSTNPPPQRSKTSAQAIARAAKMQRAVDMRLAGFTLQQIAETTGQNRSTVLRHIEAAVRGISDPAKVAELRDVELGRLERAHLAIWPSVVRGDLKAVDTFIRLSARRAALLGLDAPKKLDVENDGLSTLADLASAIWERQQARESGMPVIDVAELEEAHDEVGTAGADDGARVAPD